MAYIGNQPFTTAFLTDQFSGNGSTTAFTLSAAPANTNSLLVAITGVLQDPSTYSVSGTTLTFSAAPPSGTGNISVRFLGIPASGVVTTAYRTLTEFTATAGQTTFTPPSYTVGYINVFRNGVMLGTADYTASNGTTVVLVNAATAGDLVVTESFYVSSVLNAIPATAGSVGTTYLVDGSVTTAKIAAGAVVQADLATGVAGTGPAFSAYISGSSQSVTGSTWTKLACNAEEFDTNNCFDSTTNYRFTPNVAGYYQVTMGFSVSGGYTGLVTGGIYKNGSLYKQIIYQNSTWYINAGTCLVYCNGTTDYVEAYGYLGANGSFVASQSASYFQGCMVRAG